MGRGREAATQPPGCSWWVQEKPRARVCAGWEGGEPCTLCRPPAAGLRDASGFLPTLRVSSKKRNKKAKRTAIRETNLTTAKTGKQKLREGRGARGTGVPVSVFSGASAYSDQLCETQEEEVTLEELRLRSRCSSDEQKPRLSHTHNDAKKKSKMPLLQWTHTLHKHRPWSAAKSCWARSAVLLGASARREQAELSSWVSCKQARGSHGPCDRQARFEEPFPPAWSCGHVARQQVMEGAHI